MYIKKVTFKSDGDVLPTFNYTVSQFHKLISDLNRLNPKAPVSITINFDPDQIATKQNKKF